MKILTVVGARPQFIKASAVSRAIERLNNGNNGHRVSEVLLHTGQHYNYNMSQVFFDQLKIPVPQYHLDIKSKYHGEMTGLMLARIEPILLTDKPDFVMVYGDTNSTLAGALAAAKLHIPVIHVEAGLRSFNPLMPEEINRVLTDHISSLLICPTKTSVENLGKEGINTGVFYVGDVMLDAFLFCRDLASIESTLLSDLGLNPRSYYLATIHRQENSDNAGNLEDIFRALHQLASADCPVIFPMHPRTEINLMALERKTRLSPHVRLIPPVSYLDMIALETQARLILTDSGGVQKEAYFSGVPCVTLRNETEWTETVQSGWNRLAGTECQKITDACEQAIHYTPAEQPQFYGDGRAGEKLVRDVIWTYF
jgi:UDP-GlcNAc3NAcA epimerase